VDEQRQILPTQHEMQSPLGAEVDAADKQGLTPLDVVEGEDGAASSSVLRNDVATAKAAVSEAAPVSSEHNQRLLSHPDWNDATISTWLFPTSLEPMCEDGGVCQCPCEWGRGERSGVP
jgi:hypothetical protein